MNTSIVEQLYEVVDIIDNKKYESLIQLYRGSISPSNLKNKISDDLYTKYCTELDCVNYESYLGDGTYEDSVANDYKEAVTMIIEYLKNN